MGLGDALYVQSVARHLVKQGERLKVHTAWPDVFLPLGDKVEIAPFTRQGINILAHYSSRKPLAGTTQFEDCCLCAGIREPVELKLDWTVTDEGLAAKMLDQPRPVVIVQLPRSPMGRTDGFGKELLPDCSMIQRAIDALQDRAVIVQIGSGKPLHRFNGIHIDLSNKTTVKQLLDVASLASGFLGYCSFLLPLAESFDKPALMIWSSRGMRASHAYVRQITPKKVIHKPTTKYVVDDWQRQEIMRVVDAFLR